MRVFNATSRTRIVSALFVFAALFTSQWAFAQCTSTPGGGYGTNQNPVCPGTSNPSGLTDCWPGEYSSYNLLTTNTYTFSSSVATDYLTIMDATGTITYAFGVQPLSGFVPPSNGLYRVNRHLSAACGTSTANRTMTVTCAAAGVCSGTPAPGNTTASEAVVCSNENLTLGLQNAIFGTGVLYQWYESTTGIGGPYNPVGAGNNTHVTVQSAADVWYFCDVTCTASGLTGSSNPVNVLLETNFNNCYCTAAATDLNAAFEKIDNVTIANVNNASDTAPPFTQGYQDFTGITANLAQTASFPITVSYINGWVSDQTRVWIDYNQDGTFDNATELAFESGVGSSDAVGIITVPGTATLGNTRMRIRMFDTFGGGSFTPCGNHTFGQVEDYTVNIAAPPSCLTPAILSITENSATWADASVAFNDGGPGYEISYGPTPTAAGAGTVISSATSPATITGLSNGVDYDVYVRQNCGGLDGDSDWSPATIFNNYITVGTTGSEAYTTCGGTITDVGGLLGDYDNFSVGEVVLTPANATDVIRFQGNVDFEAGFDAVFFFEGVGTGGTQIDGYTGTGGPIDVVSIGAGVPVTVQVFSDAGGVLSGMDLTMTCEVAPTCTAPALVFANNVTTNSADITWGCVSCTGTYIIEYGPLGFTPGTGAGPGVGGTVVTDTASPLALTGLTPGTDYDLYVRQDCGLGDISANSAFVVSFSTAAPPDCATSPIYTCGTNQTYSVNGPGAWLLTDGTYIFNTTQGDEQVYRFTPPSNGTYTFQVTSSIDPFFSPMSYWYKEASLGCDDLNWNYIQTPSQYNLLPQSVNFGPLVAGTEYYILADCLFPDNVTQTFNISCTPIVPPANDVCAGATSFGCGGTVTGSTANATNDNEDQCDGFNSPQTAPGVWHTILGTGGLVQLSTFGSAYDTKLSVYTGTCGSLVCAGYNDDFIGLSSQVDLATTNGVTYYVLVHGFATGTGTYSLSAACVFPPAFDSPAGAINIPLAGNAFPTCGQISGTTVGCFDSPEDFNTGEDCWYKFTAVSSGVSIRLTSGSMDDVISLFDNTLTVVDIEDLGIFGGDQEIMNYGGLTPGNQYFICLSNYSSFFGTPGPFTLCLRHLTESSCDDGPGTYDLCTNFKANYTGANSYSFNFTPTSIAGPTVSATTAAQVPLSSAGLGLQHNEDYDVTVDCTFNNLFDGNGNQESITVLGSAVCPITIAPHANLRTKLSQRCPATVLKGTTLQAKPFICAAVNHTITFREVGDCLGTDIGGLPFNSSTSGSSPTKKLSQVSGVQAGKWYEVTWRPNFSYGAGTPGTTDIIYVAGAADGAVTEATDLDSSESVIEANLYPNPNNGDMVNLNITNVTSDNVFVRITDAQGRIVYSNRFTVDGSLNTIVTFNNALAAGLYNVEFTVDSEVFTQRMIVQK